MRITLVTLSFNQREFLERTLQSVFRQGYRELEYIIVDPGSRDGSRELIEKYRDEFAHVVFEPDRGPSDGLNRGFGFATGEIYGFLNADDTLMPHALDRVGGYFTSHPECDVLMGDGFYIDAKDRVLRHVRTTPFTTESYLYSGISWMQQATFFRSEVFQKVGGFNVANRSSWDGELLLNMAKAGARFESFHQDLGGFRVHGGSITSRIVKGGTDPMAAAFRSEARRMFRETTGREWGPSDDLRAMKVRLTRKLSRPDELLQAILCRLRSYKR